MEFKCEQDYNGKYQLCGDTHNWEEDLMSDFRLAPHEFYLLYLKFGGEYNFDNWDYSFNEKEDAENFINYFNSSLEDDEDVEAVEDETPNNKVLGNEFKFKNYQDAEALIESLHDEEE